MKVKIGLETHIQLNTMSKAFCGCRNPASLPEEPEPNTLVCDTCLGLPGSKPRANRAMLDKAIRVALALGCRISRRTYFSRKTYFYPDMSKNFQITQYEVPLAEHGQMMISQRPIKVVKIRRIHMEEDPSRIVHVGGLGGRHTLLDYNRAGIPLVEIVTEPDMSSPEEARLFLQTLETVLEYLGVYDPASKAVFKSDANISLAGGKRVEVKNITGTREIEQALKFEIFRQRNLLRRGGRVAQSTRTWNPETKTTRELRAKETEEDYGYIFEGDLTEIRNSKKKIDDIKKLLPELPDQKLNRFVRDYKLSPEIAESIVSDIDIANLFEKIAKNIDPSIAGTWISGYLKKTLNWNNIRFRQSGLKVEWVRKILKMFIEGKFTDRNAELVIRKMVDDKKDPEAIITKYKIPLKVAKEDYVIRIIDEVLRKNKVAVKDYIKGEEKALHFLIGQCMKLSRGSIDAKAAKEIILKRIQPFE